MRAISELFKWNYNFFYSTLVHFLDFLYQFFGIILYRDILVSWLHWKQRVFLAGRSLKQNLMLMYWFIFTRF
jgi:hypothetical protein